MALAPVAVADEAVVDTEPRDKAVALVTEILTSYPARAAFAEQGMAVELVVEGDELEPVVSIRIGGEEGEYVDVFVRGTAWDGHHPQCVATGSRSGRREPRGPLDQLG